MIDRKYYPLDLAANKIGCSENDLIHLGGIGKLKIYINPGNWAHRGFDSNTSIVINDPILIDDPVYLSKLDRGLKVNMLFSDSYPDSSLENLDASKVDFIDGKFLVDGKYCDYHDPKLGVPITRERLVIMLSDIRHLQKNKEAGQQKKTIGVDDLFTNPPTNNSDTFEEIKEQAIKYINNHQHLPTKEQLWGFLKVELNYDYKHRSVELPKLLKSLNYNAFTVSFNRWTKKQ